MLLAVDPLRPEREPIARAADLLRAGRLVAFPTETVYGLGANALDPRAIDRVYAAKGRPAHNPLIVHVPSAAAARELVQDWSSDAEALARDFWPGPLTLVLRKRASVPDAVTAGLPAIAVRVPRHPVALALLEAARVPIAAPSANRSSELSPTSAAHVVRSLGGRVDLVLDAGPTHVGIESTVVDLSSERPRILRPGTISAEAIEKVVGPLARADVAPRGDAPRLSPGQIERHYAPRARLVVVRAGDASAAREALEARAREQIVGLVTLGALDVPSDVAVKLTRDADEYARRLYALLHELDDAGCALVLVEEPPDEPAWAGVRDRLRRASAPA